MRYQIKVTNLNAGSPLNYYARAGALETQPAPITPNIPGGSTAVLQVRVKQNAIAPISPAAAAGIGEIYYTRQEHRPNHGLTDRIYKVIIMRVANHYGHVLVHRRWAPAGAGYNATTLTGFAAYAAPPLMSMSQRLLNRAVHLGVVHFSVSV